MLNTFIERLAAKILAVGATLTTILVVSGSVTDPVNAPKLVVIGGMGGALLGVLLSSGFVNFVRLYKLEVSLGFLFILASIVSTVSSDSPVSQNLFGSYGRNNGLISYLFLVVIFLVASSLKSIRSFDNIVRGLIFAGLLNMIYCLWVIVFGDFIGWYNPYGNILGTLGNPNFIGSFLGIFFASYLAYFCRQSSSRLGKWSLILVLPITAFEIYDSQAIQGRVVAALGLGILGFLFIRSRFNNFVANTYLLVMFLLGLLSLLGALQIGPLTKYIYKNSVSLRGQYWLAGWNTGESHPFTGVGMDAFGDWYRRSRDGHALELPGVNTVVNAAHNVPIDMFAFGGWPLLSSYVAIIVLATVSTLRLIIRKRTFDPVFAALLTAWAGYQLQSIISINQLGLAVWGWLLSGTLIAYEKLDRESLKPPTKTGVRATKPIKSTEPASTVMAAIFGILGMLVALPPLVSDAQLRSAQLAQSAEAIENTMTPSVFNPPNSNKYITNIQALEASNLFDLSHRYALEAVAWNPESFDLWKLLYLIKNSTPDEKDLALENMKRLDPLNPDVALIR